MRKGDPFPYKRDPFQKNLASDLGSLGAHQVGWGVHQGRQAGPQGSPGGAQHCRRHRRHAQSRLRLQLQAGDVIHDAEGVGDHHGDEGAAHDQAQKTAAETGEKGVAQIFFGDGQPGKAQGLQCADLGALLLHHAGHGGETGQGRHQEEDDREDTGQVAHPVRVLGVAHKAAVGAAAQHIPLTFVDFVHLSPGVVQLGLGVCDFLVCLGLALLVVRLAAGVVCLALLELRQGACQLRAALFFGFVQLGGAAVVVCPAAGDGGLGLVQLGPDLIQLCLGGVQFRFCGVQLSLALI